jgi:hypothetical protein
MNLEAPREAIEGARLTVARFQPSTAPLGVVGYDTSGRPESTRRNRCHPIP